MGERGPAPTPSNILQLRGSTLAGRNASEPTPEQARPRAPRYLLDDEKRLWRRVCDVLHAMGVMTRADVFALARYVELLSEYRKARTFLAEHGHQHPVKKWDRQQRKFVAVGFKTFPEVKTFLQITDRLLKLEREFGLTPSARTRIMVDVDTSSADKPIDNPRRNASGGFVRTRSS